MAEVESNLKTIALALQDLDKYRSQLISKVDDLESIGRLREINLTDIQSSINEELGALGKLKNRFSRNTLNIGVIGRARQGKSRLLQSLSGLSDEIPTGSLTDCTAVRSTIHHNPNVETYGEVWFHSERSFLDEVIHPYYEKLNLGIKPFTVEEFARNLPSIHSDASAEVKAIYKNLSEYHINFDKYKHLFSQASPHRISKEQVREYVAQYSIDGKEKFFNFFAVREVKIVCSFPQSDVGQITLVDMPGLGNTRLGDDKRLIQILGQDIDVVMFVKKPDPLGDNWQDVDVSLYDIARSALTDLPIHLWSFFVLNQINQGSDNSALCHELSNSSTKNGIKVVQTIVADCTNADEANKEILDPILRYLTENIAGLDQQYATNCQDRLTRLQSAAKTEIEKAKTALGISSKGDSWFPVFVNLFDQLWEDLTVGLEGLLRELRCQRDVQDIDFKNQVNAAIQKCKEDTGIPSIEDIKVSRAKVAAYGIAYEKYLHEIRAHLSQHFLSLDDGLKQSLEGIKAQVVDILSKVGKLSALTDKQGSEFLSDIENILPADLAGLKLGFNILASFNLSYRGLIQHRIRKHLDRLTPDDATLRLSSSPSAQEILVNLQTLHAEALYECESALEELLCEPSQAAYAIVEEFVDRVLRAKDVYKEWLIFLQEVRSDIWASEFEKLGENSRLRREWLTVVDKARSANQDHLIKLLK
ncbi:hypothetical protein [Pseudanabaena galeata]|uniref:hypothetical protein n=1 Tax=Pseudanabaena galeata TaxID=1112103 RepID=UPI002478C659|nr:hypothetical protein [Pseudanabaena galeata]MEA5489852.1 hypothetical protein [Pseudanabaena sp. CCNP1317]WGS74141.1 hypothetical protein OA858_08985 [Pseudanabaena galeata CCNP1313]